VSSCWTGCQPSWAPIIHFTWLSIVQSLVLCFGARLGWVGPLGSRLRSKKQKAVGPLQGVSGSREAQLGCVRGGSSGPGVAVEGVSQQMAREANTCPPALPCLPTIWAPR